MTTKIIPLGNQGGIEINADGFAAANIFTRLWNAAKASPDTAGTWCCVTEEGKQKIARIVKQFDGGLMPIGNEMPTGRWFYLHE